mgnify:CR=1 FL=1|tara:strand:+ start:1587 stop:1913 length:327 start_codon:yes stop_codon:yes gene_type:complete
MIKVYQIQLTDAEIDIANREESTPRIKAFFNKSFDSTFKAENFQYYDHVANVDVAANDVEEAFRLMNLWDDKSKVEKFGRCSSMSVGDILETEDGSKYRCATFGFDAL